ncbi:hypothetical protein GCM10027052_03830 [Parafrigoribacterium mesophilum]|uniref:hypothetical protein n=1 Tax=Parafrigoribacterium mesophilum TaxID=433646 RepID=UPI0031FD6B86
MRFKMLFVAGLATGYVLGAKAGRHTYEGIKAKATQAWEDPRVHKVVSDAQDFVKDAAPVVQTKVSEATSAAADTAKVAGQKMAEGAASLRERIMEAVDTVLQKVGQGEGVSRDDSAGDRAPGDAAPDHAAPPIGSSERPLGDRPSTQIPPTERPPTASPGAPGSSPL